MTKPDKPTPPGHEGNWTNDPAWELVGFVPCVPFLGPDGDVEEGILKTGAKRMEGVVMTLQSDETLIVESSGKRQVYPKGLASLIFAPKESTP